MSNAERIQAFYDAFAKRDAEAMVACYHPQVIFQDPVFGTLEGDRAGKMWEMLCARGRDLRITVSDIEADGNEGQAHWQAHYTFAKTGRSVHNRIDAVFTFEDGLIKTHTDSFDLYAWMRMALGIKGTLVGWLPSAQRALQKRALRGLERFRP